MPFQILLIQILASSQSLCMLSFQRFYFVVVFPLSFQKKIFIIICLSVTLVILIIVLAVVLS